MNILISPSPVVERGSGEVTIGTVARKICGKPNSLCGMTPRSKKEFESRFAQAVIGADVLIR